MLRRLGLRQSSVPAFIFTSLVVAGIVAVGFVFALSQWMASEANRQAAIHVENLVDSALGGVTQRVSLMNLDYAYWEEAYFAVVEKDDAWVDSNIGGSTEITGVLHIAQITSGAGDPIYGYDAVFEENQGRVLPMRVIDAFVTTLREQPIEPEITVAGLANIGGQDYLLGASHMFSYDPEEMEEGLPPVLITGIEFSAERLNELSGEYLVEDLRLTSVGGEVPEGFGDRLLYSVDGRVVSNLMWRLPRPGGTLMETALPAIGIMSLILFVSLVYVARKSSVMAETIVSERELARTSARTDGLTDLVNRAGLMETVRRRDMLESIAAGEMAVVNIDLNEFKAINDQLGHDAGDRALMITAERLRAAARHYDVVARLGGDEFVCLLSGPDPQLAAQAFCKRLIAQMANPVPFEDQMRFIRSSIGVAIADTGDCWEDLMVRSDVAMYHAKRTGSTEPVFFSDDLCEAHNWEKSVEERLRRGLKDVTKGKSPFRMEFQPIVNGQDGTAIYAEALLRWNDRSLGAVSPGDFIPIAEARGLLPELGAHVLTECCEIMQRAPELNLSVNISPLQLVEEDFAARVLDITRSAGIKPERLILEITENALIEVPETARDRIDALRAHGFRFALDDFGTGYASISYLKHFPFDTLKIDRSYLDDVETSVRARALFSTFVQLGQTLGMDVVAEGVETEAQSAIVLGSGCLLHQGFHHAYPMPIDELIEFCSKDVDRKTKPSRSVA